jgi:phosphoglucosamine mutase
MGRYFGTDGIRGEVGTWPLVPEFFLNLGKAVGQVVHTGNRPLTMIVGRDTRQSGEMLQNALTAGLLSGGIDVIDVGVTPTAGIAWLLRKLGLQAGAVISASHNPVEQNGVKFIDADGLKFSEKLEDQIEGLLLADVGDSQFTKLNKRLGRCTDGNSYHELYIQGLAQEHEADFLKGLTLLADCSNGAASHFAPEVLSRAGARVIAIHASPDGSNINSGCGSEFARRAPWEMGKLLHHYHANFGLAFDGDADRVVFVDENGSLIDGDHMLGFLANYLHRKGQLLADSIVTTQMRNNGLKVYLERTGLKVYETPVGDKYVVEKLLELRSQENEPGQFGLGGEQAGHIDIVNEMFTTGDGIRTALFVMRAYLESGAPTLANFAAGVGKTPQIIASAYVGQGPRIDRKQLSEIEKSLFDRCPGLSRANLRYSGTEPLLRVMLESDGRQTEIDLAEAAWEVSRNAQQVAGVENGPIDILNCTRGGVISQQPGWD